MSCTSFSYVLLRLREDKGFNASAPTEDEFITLVKKSGLTRQAFEDLTSHLMGDMFLSPALTAYVRAKNIFDAIEGDVRTEQITGD